MRRAGLLSIVGLAVLGLLLISPLSSEATDYIFTKIADTDGPFARFDFGGAPAINDKGTVAFIASFNTSGLLIGGIFTGNGGPITTIADTSGICESFNFGRFFSIGKKGTVAFLCGLDTGDTAILTGSGGPLTTIVTQATSPLNSLGGPFMTSKGTIAFQAGIDGGGQGIFTTRDGPSNPIVDTSGPFTALRPVLAVNKQELIAFFGTIPALFNGGMFTTDGTTITTIAVTSNVGGEFTALGQFSMNKKGIVAFVGCIDPVNTSCPINVEPPAFEGIFVWNDDSHTTFANNDGSFRNFAGNSINNRGTVTFLARLDAGGSGVFTGPDPVADKVIATSDPLLGSTVANLAISQSEPGVGLNEKGQIAFFAELANGTQGIYRADPK